MKIEYYEGCTSSNIMIDNISVKDSDDVYDREKLLQIGDLILNKLSNKSLEYAIKELISNNSTDIEEFGKCESCGDYPCTYKLDI